MFGNSKKKQEDKYRREMGLLSIKDEKQARKRLAKRHGKGYSIALLASTGGIGAIFRARGLGKDKRLAQALERLERDQARRQRGG